MRPVMFSMKISRSPDSWFLLLDRLEEYLETARWGELKPSQVLGEAQGTVAVKPKRELRRRTSKWSLLSTSSTVPYPEAGNLMDFGSSCDQLALKTLLLMLQFGTLVLNDQEYESRRFRMIVSRVQKVTPSEGLRHRLFQLLLVDLTATESWTSTSQARSCGWISCLTRERRTKSSSVLTLILLQTLRHIGFLLEKVRIDEFANEFDELIDNFESALMDQFEQYEPWEYSGFASTVLSRAE